MRRVRAFPVERQVLTEWAHLFGLSGVAIAQPLYDLLSQNPAFFVAHRAGAWDLIGFVLVLSVAVPAGLCVIELISRMFGERTRTLVHRFFVFFLAGMALVPILDRQTSLSALPVIALATSLGAICVWLYVYWRPFYAFVSVFAVGAIVFPVYFLGYTPVNRIFSSQALTNAAAIEIKQPIPVVLLVFDEFNTTALLDEKGNIDAARFPNFGALAATSWWFPNAIAPHVRTTRSLPAILTGRQVDTNVPDVPSAGDYPDNLFVMLGEHYRLNVLEGVTRLCPANLCRDDRSSTAERHAGLFADTAVIALHVFTPSSLREDLPPLGTQWAGFGAGLFGSETDEESGPSRWRQRSKQMAAFLAGIQAGVKPQFNFFHLEIPHVVYQYLASGHFYTSENDWTLPGIASLEEKWGDHLPLIHVAYQRYLQQVGYVDRFLGKVTARLKAAGLYDDALIIVTADHGVAFRPGFHRRDIDGDNFAEILKVPMFVKLPRQKEARVSDKFVGGVDVAPTVLHVLGVDTPVAMDGIVVVDDASRRPADAVWHGGFRSEQLLGFSRLDWQAELFGSGTSLSELTLKGPYHEIVGKKVSALRVKRGSGIGAARVQGLSHYDRVDLKEVFVPALFRGTVETVDASLLPLDLAVALNGRVWATTTTASWAGSQAYFASLLPIVAFQQGKNRVELFRIARSAGVIELHALPFEDPRAFVLQVDDSGETALVSKDGTKIPVTTDVSEVRGNLDEVLIQGKDILVRGWAADVALREPVKTVIFFSGEDIVADATPRDARPDISASLEAESALYSGFSALVTPSALKTAGRDLRVFAISSRNVARELRFQGEAKEQLERVFGAALWRQVKDTIIRYNEAGAETLVFESGRKVPVTATWGEIRGNVDDVVRQGQELMIRGWAADLVASAPVESVLVFSGKRLVAAATPTEARPDVERSVGSATVRHCGFSARVPHVSAGPDAGELRLFVVSPRGVAFEFKLGERLRSQLKNASREK